LTDPASPLPSFLIIGAQKSGTRWLRLNLGRHPDVFTPDEELSFFNSRDYEEGLDRYRSGFAGWAGEPVVGEATPGYMIWRCEPPLVASRIDADLPEVRLIALLRNPVDRLYSAFVHHVMRKRIDPNEEIRELVAGIPPEDDPRQLVAGGWYARSLEPYLERFGHRLRVFLHDDVSAGPAEVYAAALEHIGGEPGYVPDQLEEVVFSRVLPEGTRYWVPETGRRDLTKEERADLLEYYGDEIDRLEAMTGLDLSRWKEP
jgi:hypothetical protein